MAKPDDGVEIFFGLEQTGAELFTLDDAVKGELDSTYVLGGDVATDVSDTVQSYSINRGRSRELDEIQAGTATVSLLNYDGRYIPSAFVTPGGTFDTTTVLPGKRVRIWAAGQVTFDGYIEDWSFEYSAVDDSVYTTIFATDSMAQLAYKRFNAWTATASQVAGERIDDVLDRAEIDWGADRDLLKSDGATYQGVSSLQGDSVTYGSNVLNYCQLVAKSDLGRLFASRSGVITYRDRHNFVGASVKATLSDDGTNIPFRSATLAYGGELLFTDVSVDREGGTAQSSNDTTARTAYGIRRLDISGLLLDSDTQSGDMADYLVNIYKQPAARVESVQLRLDRMTDIQKACLASLEISDVVNVSWTPRGAPNTLSSTFVVEGIQHSRSTDIHDVTLALTPIQQAEAFTLDSDLLGVLDTSILAF